MTPHSVTGKRNRYIQYVEWLTRCERGLDVVVNPLNVFQIRPIAQWLEQDTHNVLVPGSNPGRPIRTQ